MANRFEGSAVRFRLTAMLLVALGLGLVVAGCGSDDEGQSAQNGESVSAGDVSVIVANTNGTVQAGVPQRMLIAVVYNDGSGYVGDSSLDMTLTFSEVEGAGQVQTAGTWRSVGDRIGMYVSTVEFERSGLWEVVASGVDREYGGALLEVVVDSNVPNIGDDVPLSATPTLSSAGPDGLAAISTDADPDPSFYELTVAEAATNGQPTLIAFATPTFCRTALCGPTMEAVKVAVAGRSGVDVVHVEPFDLTQAAEGDLVPNTYSLEWALPTEPWIFLLDDQGRVAARFEGLITAEELANALDAL